MRVDGSLLFGVGAVGAAAGVLALAPVALQRSKAPAPGPAAGKTIDCRDACEQNAIIEQRTESALRACRERSRKGEPEQHPYQPIERVTRAPADHGR